MILKQCMLIACLVNGMSLLAMSDPLEGSLSQETISEQAGQDDDTFISFLNAMLRCRHGRTLLGRFRFAEIIRDWECNDYNPGETLGIFATRVVTTSLTYGENHMHSSRMQLDESLYWKEKPKNIVSALVHTISETEHLLLQKKRDNKLIPADSLFLATRDNDIMLLCALLKWDPLLMPESDNELRNVMAVTFQTHEQWCSEFPQFESAYTKFTRLLR